MRIVVLAKPVPDATGQERLREDMRLDREAVPGVLNGNDEYALEAALKLVEASPDGGEVILLAMAPAYAPETLRKGLALGATRAVLVTDPLLEGSCALTTAHVLAAALRDLSFDLVIAGVDTSDGAGGVVAAGIATLMGLPYLSYAARIEPLDGLVRVRRITRSQERDHHPLGRGSRPPGGRGRRSRCHFSSYRRQSTSRARDAKGRAGVGRRGSQ